MKISVYLCLFLSAVCLSSCHKPSRADEMRREMAQKDSLQYVQAQQTRVYSDSVLQNLLPEVDPLLAHFKYEKEDGYEDHGRYVHQLLATNKNTSRNFLQAYVTDDRRLSVQSYYYGSGGIDQRAIRLSVDEGYVEAEGTNHRFEVEGVHEVLTLTEQDALRVLEQVAAHTDSRIKVTLIGKREPIYYLQTNEKEALAETYRLALLMRDIATLEQAIRVSDRQIEKYLRKYKEEGN